MDLLAFSPCQVDLEKMKESAEKNNIAATKQLNGHTRWL